MGKEFFADSNNTVWKKGLSYRARIYGGPCMRFKVIGKRGNLNLTKSLQISFQN